MSEQIPDADGNDDLDGDDDDDDDGGDDDDGDCNVQGWPFIDHCLTSLFLGSATQIISIAPGLIILIMTMMMIMMSMMMMMMTTMMMRAV